MVKIKGGGRVMCLLNKEPNNFLVMSEHPKKGLLMGI